MPRFYFHIHDGVDLRDDVGTELPGRDAIRSHSLRLAGECIRHLQDNFWGHCEWRLDVTDEQGVNVLTLRFSGED